MLLSTHMTSVLFLEWFNTFSLTMDLHAPTQVTCSYALLSNEAAERTYRRKSVGGPPCGKISEAPSYLVTEVIPYKDVTTLGEGTGSIT